MSTLKWLIPGIVFFTASVSSCEKHVFNSIKGKGASVTETRNLSGFTQISLDINGDVHYVQDSVYYVEITAQQNVLDVITTEISDGELEIDSRKWIRKHSGITIVIHSPVIYAFDVSGSGTISAASTITTSSLDLEVSGSGNISLASVYSNNLETDISGSGNVTVSGGLVTTQEADVSGSGDIETDNLSATNVDAEISGSGSIRIWATTSLNAKISGSGNIRYKGTPSVNTTISGSGSVIHL
jgi:hypothetical protein